MVKFDEQLKAIDDLRREVRIRVLAEWDTVSAMGGFRKRKLSFVNDVVPSKVDHAFLAVALNEKRKSFQPMLWTKVTGNTKVKQCAFVGCHSE